MSSTPAGLTDEVSTLLRFCRSAHSLIVGALTLPSILFLALIISTQGWTTSTLLMAGWVDDTLAWIFWWVEPVVDHVSGAIGRDFSLNPSWRLVLFSLAAVFVPLTVYDFTRNDIDAGNRNILILTGLVAFFFALPLETSTVGYFVFLISAYIWCVSAIGNALVLILYAIALHYAAEHPLLAEDAEATSYREASVAATKSNIVVLVFVWIISMSAVADIIGL